MRVIPCEVCGGDVPWGGRGRRPRFCKVEGKSRGPCHLKWDHRQRANQAALDHLAQILPSLARSVKGLDQSLSGYLRMAHSRLRAVKPTPTAEQRQAWRSDPEIEPGELVELAAWKLAKATPDG